MFWQNILMSYGLLEQLSINHSASEQVFAMGQSKTKGATNLSFSVISKIELYAGFWVCCHQYGTLWIVFLHLNLLAHSNLCLKTLMLLLTLIIVGSKCLRLCPVTGCWPTFLLAILVSSLGVDQKIRKTFPAKKTKSCI